MSLNYYSVLGLSQSFSLKDLEDAYKKKVNSIMESNTLSDVDKHMLLASVKKYFDQAYMGLVRRTYFATENLLVPSIEAHSLFNSKLDAFGESLRKIDSHISSSMKDTQNTQDGNNTTVYSSSSVYREKLMPDGSKIVLKESTSNKNGDVTRSTNSYRQFSSGVTEPMDFENALAQVENKILM
jgi:hypothetical protein